MSEKPGGVLNAVFSSAAKAHPTADGSTADLDMIFGAATKGYREILLTILVAKEIDPGYKPTTAFYSCNPRTLYEGPIRSRLTSLRVPRGKSGPLNIAKATQGLNAAWASRRREKQVAMAVVRMAKIVEDADSQRVRELGIEVARRFLTLAVQTAALFVEADVRQDLVHLLSLSTELMDRATAGGATAQRIVGLILELTTPGEGAVEGSLDSVSATNTTSKKAGDFTIRIEGMSPRVVEVTQKAFGRQRMEDSYESVRAMEIGEDFTTSEVLVLCRGADVPEEVSYGAVGHPPDAYRGSLNYRDITFEFVEINDWIAAHLATMTPEQRLVFHQGLSNYAADPNTSKDVKSVWVELAV